MRPVLPIDDAIEAFCARNGLDDAARGDLRMLMAGTKVTLDQPRGLAAYTMVPEDPSEPIRPVNPFGDIDRYEILDQIGRGASSVVHRVRDRRLDRPLAMKILASYPESAPDLARRFEAEARVMARLEHPGIVPVHDIGRLPDGRLYYTMTQVRGRTLTKVIEAVHRLPEPWVVDSEGWSMRRLIDVFRRVCEAMASAHAEGVLHRDLKPDNVMVGPFGQVLVLDWGLVKRLGHRADSGGGDEDEASAHTTRQGVIAGTPAFMAPEQARGEVAALGPASDVYSLGRVLEAILLGTSHFGARMKSREVLSFVAANPPPGMAETDALGRPLPPALRELAARCLAVDPAERFADAGALATAVGEWQDGARARERAMALVDDARALLPQIAGLRARSASLRDRAAQELADIAPWAPEGLKVPSWRLEDEAVALHREATVETVRFTRILQSALNRVPDLPEANGLLADHYQALHSAAEAAHELDDAARYEALLRDHDPGRHAAWLRGTGAVTLVTDPPGARVRLFRFVERDRRLIAEPEGDLGTTPIHQVPLEHGSYLLLIEAEGHAPVRYPVQIGRGEHWSGVPPEGGGPFPVPLPRLEDQRPDELYVPPSWFQMGGDEEAHGSLAPQRVWLDGFFVRRFAVTNAEFICFLDALVASGDEALALQYGPSEAGPKGQGAGALSYHRTPSGGFEVGLDGDGDRWYEDGPAVLIDFAGAEAFTSWLSRRDGLPWRLPWEAEFEKAARGVDARRFPWGDHFDPSRTMTRDSVASLLLPQLVDTFPIDESPYGVRSLAGNAMTWCMDDPHAHGPPVIGGRVLNEQRPGVNSGMRALRGGSWNAHAAHSHSARRDANRPTRRMPYVGVRLVRPWPESPIE